MKLIAAMLFISAPAAAQIVNDPTRPPIGLGAGAADGELEGVAGGGMMLQSVMISPSQKAAIISGVMVRLGEKYGDAVLIRVAENQVVLRSGDTEQVLKLYPAVEKREITPVAERPAQRRGKASAGAALPR
jgi:MSHA biogenesis protein MshK